ncbi:hypothetical protein EW145_g4611 [Phellinidium pouzarii]|uniref:Vacuolar protein sorting-associated protein 28 n=1 Tax=Phellinidium pouzarii TaxID=167371 RepID=A0A4S4L499_9AGAM|nr:hypothetical protein EW145_g4611 [Phellinidium pouzarii]
MTMLKLVGADVPSIEEFMERYRMDHPAALHRIKVGVPATVEHSSEAGPETGKWVAETTQSFITFMDALKLRMRAKDQLHPILQELMTNYARFKASKDWEGRSRMVSWLITLNGMKASEEISEEQSRQVSILEFQSVLKRCRILLFLTLWTFLLPAPVPFLFRL